MIKETIMSKIVKSIRKKENRGIKPTKIIMTRQGFDKLRDEFLEQMIIEIETIFGMKIEVIEDFKIIGVNKW